MHDPNRRRTPNRKPRHSHIIIMKEVSPPKTASFLGKRLGLIEKSAPQRGTAVLTSDTGRTAHHYHALGMVAVSLTPDEVRGLMAEDAVRSIRPNRAVRMALPAASQPRPAAPAFSLGSAVSGLDRKTLQGYMMGVSSVASAIASYLGSAELGVPGPVEQPESVPRSRSGAGRGDQDEEWSWSLRSIGMRPGYSTATGKGVKVAVLDTGVDLDHPDLAHHFVGHKAENLESFIEGEDVDDGNGHGTHVSGIVAGATDSSGGIRYSVAPDAELLVGKVLDNRGDGSDDTVLSGIAWASVMGARVVNLSLGGERELDGWFEQDYEVLADRVAEASATLLIAAAGNDSDRNAEPPTLAPVDNPAAAPSIVAVAACDSKLLPGWFSNAELDIIGRLDVSAPGVDIYSTYNDGSFAYLDGTSMATPHVAGLAALRLEMSPALSPEALRAEIRETVRRPPPPAARRDYGHGVATAP